MGSDRRFVGYDPGGTGRHGVAELVVDAGGQVVRAKATTVGTADAALAFLCSGKDEKAAAGVGVDTLTEWCLGPSGWRPADSWLRQQYPTIANSVTSPNSLYGAMAVNGMGALVSLRAANADLVVSETHPKVLYFELSKRMYAWGTSGSRMTAWLGHLLGIHVPLTTDHAFDALLSAWACSRGALGLWSRDLHKRIHGTPAQGTMIRPVGTTNYFWP